ncbi:Photosynthesis system II assembly factor YCF48 [Thermoanaerobacter thermohydrosulfuricus]|nr:Photosynthesis system II assembly factor YCF48 [Thermoanaerobacter thermohydrosulfuricus]
MIKISKREDIICNNKKINWMYNVVKEVLGGVSMKKIFIGLLILTLFFSGCQINVKNHDNLAKPPNQNVSEDVTPNDIQSEKWKWSFKDNKISSLKDLQLYNSDDGGKTWTQIYIPVDKIPESAYKDAENIVPYFMDNNVWIAWIVPQTLHILKTKDGGLHWDIFKFEIGKYGEAISVLQFVTPEEGWILTTMNGAGMQINYLLKTNDGGKRWENVNITGKKNYDGIYSAADRSNMKFYNKNNEWISISNNLGPAPLLFRTTDGGKSWSKIELSVPEIYKNCYLSSANVPVFADNKQGKLILELYGPNKDNKLEKHILVYETIDGGNTWRLRKN